jgi:Tol biopolymer transport system component
MTRSFIRQPSSRSAPRFVVGAVLGLALVASGTAASAQTPVAADCTSTWADGTGLVWSVFCSDADGPGDLYQREPDGDVRRLTELGAAIGGVSITPDGGLVIFDATSPDAGSTQIYSLSRSGGEPQALTSDGVNRDPLVDPSGSGIVFVSDRDGANALWSMQVDGSGQRRLLLASTE